MPLLVVLDTRKDNPLVVDLIADRYIIGASSDCDIVVIPKYNNVADHHAMLIKNSNGYAIEAETEGLWIGENVISRTRVYPKTRKFNEEAFGYDVRRVSSRERIATKQLENEETVWFHKDFKVGIKYFA